MKEYNSTQKQQQHTQSHSTTALNIPTQYTRVHHTAMRHHTHHRGIVLAARKFTQDTRPPRSRSRHNAPHRSTPPRNTPRHNATYHSTTHRNTPQHITVRQRGTRLSTTRLGRARHGNARHDMGAQHPIMSRHGTGREEHIAFHRIARRGADDSSPSHRALVAESSRDCRGSVANSMFST